ncbi:hypothetical protein LshimejAT787_0704830 [Lyophyllum shimeji]|uniref:Uncharacterized protein n=1 Tax=Lyophyllum shimeji TaxID=47721 RepID=A0A9P3PQ30_LYOSH|nr:hypothetical protein LshimejAT787_0704830 [Lyophyllum shimeji]
MLLVVPTALEVIFCTSLVFTNWGTGRRYLWLTAEGWVHFSLALVEMLSHILPAARDHADVFRAFDTVLAAASFLPVLLYTLFTFLFARVELITGLPNRLQTIAKLLLLIFIPAIVAGNEAASFVGISRRVITVGSQSVLAIGFSNDKNQTLWTFSTSLTLALLTAYQAINFTFAFYRLIKALLDQRRIDTTSSDEVHLFKGIGWITGGLKLGAIETVIGFAAAGFGSAMTRRIIRLLARACLVIGLVKGLDSSEDFRDIRDELSGAGRRDLRRSRLREFISNPRHSTFRQLTPTATAFHAAPRAPAALSQFSPEPRSQDGLTGMRQFAEVKQAATTGDISEKPARERVTIHFEGGTPSLHMRFSALEIPILPPLSVNNSPRQSSEWVSVSRPTFQSSPSTHSSHSSSPRRATYCAPSPRNSLLSALTISDSGLDISNLKTPQQVYSPPTKPARVESSYSQRSIPESYTSLSAVRELASQFPPLPTRVLETIKQSPANQTSGEFWDDSTSLVSKPSITRRRSSTPISPGSDVDPFMNEEVTSKAVSNSNLPDQPILTLRNPSADFKAASVPTSALSTPVTVPSGYTPTPPAQSTSTTDTDDAFLDFGSVLDTGKSRAFTRDSAGSTHPADWIDYEAIPKTMSVLAPVAEEADGQPRVSVTRGASHSSRRSSSLGALTISWLKSAEMEEEERRLARAVSRKAPPSRIKSIGKAPMRSTPLPTRTGQTRGSLHIERIMIPPKQESNVEIVQGSLDSTHGRSVLRDSEVLGIEDGSYARDMRLKGYI